MPKQRYLVVETVDIPGFRRVEEGETISMNVLDVESLGLSNVLLLDDGNEKILIAEEIEEKESGTESY